MLRALPAVFVLAGASCRDMGTGDGGAAGGTVIIATAADADFLLPPLIRSSIGKQISDMLFEPVALIGDGLNTLGDKGFTPRLANRWQWSPDSMSIVFHLDPRARWHDGRPVVANDVKFSFDLFRNPAVHSATAGNLSLIDSVSVRDSSTFVVWYKSRSPEQFFIFVYNVTPIPAHVYATVAPEALAASESARSPVGSGRFRFSRWDVGSTVEIVADTTAWRGRPKLDRLIWSTTPDPTSAMAKVLAGEADFIEVLRGDALERAATSTTVRAISRPSLDNGLMIFRMVDGKNKSRPHPVFGDPAVRRSIAMAIDRPTLVLSVLDTLGATGIGPIVRELQASDTTVVQLAFDIDAAKALLDSAGWRDSNGDGVRERAGRRLEFDLMSPTSSTPRMRAAVIIQEQLRKIGVGVKVLALENNAMMPRLFGGTFDAALLVFSSDASPSGMRQNWSSEAARTGAGFNASGYENATFDATLDSALAAFDPTESRALYRRATATLLADVPAIWLYEPRGSGAMHRRVKPAAMRADYWWAHLDDWSIEPSQMIGRDSIGLRLAAR